jgi:hypothetical protein
MKCTDYGAKLPTIIMRIPLITKLIKLQIISLKSTVLNFFFINPKVVAAYEI